MLFIGICGASGSGKTTLAEELTRDLGVPTTVINQDGYYLDHPDMTFEERCLLNYDEPDIFDHDLLYQDICTLLSGQPITRKVYDFSRHARADGGELVEPTEVLIVEGIHAFYDRRLMDKMYLKLYISVEPDICLLRRITRDIKDRGRAIDNIASQYLATVKPMYDRYIRNYVHEADVIVARGGKNAKIVDILAGYVRDQLIADHRQREAEQAAKV
ncbi:MAG: uridine kinase [Clostridia bacterium]|nr:uridine kinase [Clostridia bacterium]